MYLTNPVYAMIVGSVAGIIQVVGQIFIEKPWIQKRRVLNTHSFILFGFQGIWGGIYASILRKRIETIWNGFQYNFDWIVNPAGYDLAIALLCAAFGLAFGLIIGLFFFCFAKHDKEQHFTDFTYWDEYDGLRFPENLEDVQYSELSAEVFIKETVANVKAKFSYI